VIALALSYAGIATLVVGSVLFARLPLVSQALVVVVAPLVSFAIWQASQAPTGWPTTSGPPDDAAFIAGYVSEPDASVHNPGEIDLLLNPVGAKHPRLFRLPYSRGLHEQVLAAAQASHRGGTRIVVRGASNGRFRFYVLPPTALPQKPS
jgi:hypothetical protein